MGLRGIRRLIIGSRADPYDDWHRYAAPAKPKLGYHTSNALTSTAAPHREPPRGLDDDAQIIAIPPFTCSVWPVMGAAFGEARKPAAPATSAPAPSLPAGTRARIVSRCLSLSLSV